MANRNREYIDFLKQRFDENKFIEFISDLLNLSSEDIDSLIAEQKPEQKQFRDTIEYYKFVANYASNSDKIGTFIVKLTSEGSQKCKDKLKNIYFNLIKEAEFRCSIGCLLSKIMKLFMEIIICKKRIKFYWIKELKLI